MSDLSRSPNTTGRGEVEAGRRKEVESVINGVRDPCSVAVGVQIGVIDMGLIEDLAVEGDRVRLRILPTFAGCLYLGMIAAEIAERVGGLEWCSDVDIGLATGTGIWTEARIAPHARRRLARRRGVS